MDNVTSLVPVLWGIIGHHKHAAANIIKSDDMFLISIKHKTRWIGFTGYNFDTLMADIKSYFKLN